MMQRKIGYLFDIDKNYARTTQKHWIMIINKEGRQKKKWIVWWIYFNQHLIYDKKQKQVNKYKQTSDDKTTMLSMESLIQRHLSLTDLYCRSLTADLSHVKKGLECDGYFYLYMHLYDKTVRETVSDHFSIVCYCSSLR